MTSEADVAAAFRDATVERERSGFRLLALLSLMLMPLVILFDSWRIPQLAPKLLPLRLANAATMAAVFWALARERDATRQRLLGAAAAWMTGTMAAIVVASVDSAFLPPYAVGFSTLFWAMAVALSWPVRWQAATQAAILATFLVAGALGHTRTREELTIISIFLTNVAVVGTSGLHLRRRAEWRAFVSAHALERRNRELAAALAQLKEAEAHLIQSQKQAALGRMLAGLSHEINNPVNVIQNNLPVIREYLDAQWRALDAARGHPPVAALWAELDLDFVRRDAAAAVGAMTTAVERIRGIHADLRSFVRGRSVERTDTDLNEGLRATLAMLHRSIPAGVTVEAEYGELPPVRAHGGQLNQVLLNLLQNALDAVGERGRVRVRTRACAGAVEITVTDDGPGVAPEARDRLFEPFFTTRGAGKGTGLGLAICDQIVRSHGGTLALDTGYGGGARFVVTLPTSQSATLAA